MTATVARHHQGVAFDRLVHLGGGVPADHERPHRSVNSRATGSAFAELRRTGRSPAEHEAETRTEWKILRLVTRPGASACALLSRLSSLVETYVEGGEPRRPRRSRNCCGRCGKLLAMTPKEFVACVALEKQQLLRSYTRLDGGTAVAARFATTRGGNSLVAISKRKRGSDSTAAAGAHAEAGNDCRASAAQRANSFRKGADLGVTRCQEQQAPVRVD